MFVYILVDMVDLNSVCMLKNSFKKFVKFSLNFSKFLAYFELTYFWWRQNKEDDLKSS
jgi:hypothetical protein